MYIQSYIYIYIHTHTHIHTYIHTVGGWRFDCRSGSLIIRARYVICTYICMHVCYVCMLCMCVRMWLCKKSHYMCNHYTCNHYTCNHYTCNKHIPMYVCIACMCVYIYMCMQVCVLVCISVNVCSFRRSLTSLYVPGM